MRLPTEIEICSKRPIIGRIVVLYKKIVGFVIRPYLRNVFEAEHQIQNEKIERIERRIDEKFNEVDERFDKVDERFDKVDKRFGEVTTDILQRTDSLFATLDQRQETLSARQEKLKGMKPYETREVSQELTLQKRRLELILSELRKKARLDDTSIKAIADQEKHLMDHSYFMFENKFRGSREDIKKRQEVYLSVFRKTYDKNEHKKSCILDIGSGRGEFLELLKGNGIPAKGIDVNEDMVYFCQQRELEVEQAEAISYLKNIKDDSLCGVIACQFIEHLNVDALIEFVKLVYEKVKKGGRVIFETINPESIFAMKWFYLDMSHEKPIHPQAISFLMESIGFFDIDIKYLSPVPDDFRLKPTGDENIEILNNMLFGYQDYAVIASR